MAKRKPAQKFDGDDLKQVAFLALAIILTLEMTALLMGIDGTMFGISLAGIGAIIGYLLKAYSVKGQ